MEKDMTKGHPLAVILKFTLPLLIGNVFQQLYNMADTIIVGRCVSADALAAVGSTGTIMFLIVGFAQGITAGFTILTSQRFGARDTDGVKRSVANGILLSVICTIILTGVSLLCMRPLLKLMNTPDNIFDDAYSYIMIISGGLVTTVFYNLFSSYLRAVGNSQIPLVFLVFSAVLNVILDLVFIAPFHMGESGAGDLRRALPDLHLSAHAGAAPGKESLEASRKRKPSADDHGNPYGTAVCNYRLRNHDHAGSDQHLRF